MSRFNFSLRASAILIALALLHFNFRADAALANCWHIPDNAIDLGFTLRNPETAIGVNMVVRFYTGVYKFNGATQLCNQTGGILYFKTSAQSSWSSTNLSFYSNASANQYWQTALPSGLFSGGDTVQYFFLLTFDGYAGVSNTWLYGNNAGSTATASSNTAAASPFTYTVTNNILGTPVLTVNGVNADYTTTHVFVNELNNDAVPLTLLFTPNGGTVTNVEIFPTSIVATARRWMPTATASKMASSRRMEILFS